MARQIRGEEALVAGNKGAGGNGARAAPGGLARGFLFLLLLQNRNSFLREEISLEDASAGRRTVSPRAFDQRAIEFAAASLLGIGAQRNLAIGHPHRRRCKWLRTRTTDPSTSTWAISGSLRVETRRTGSPAQCMEWNTDDGTRRPIWSHRHRVQIWPHPTPAESDPGGRARRAMASPRPGKRLPLLPRGRRDAIG